MNTKDKHAYFQKIAEKRLARILEDLDSLGGCSNPATYCYENSEIEQMIQSIYTKLEEVRQRLILRSPYSGVPFRLLTPEVVELDGHTIRRGDLATLAEVMTLLVESAPTFVSLEPIRTRYAARFGDELCWNFPLFHDGHTGCILLPVQEGVLYLAYNSVDSEEYEQFDLQELRLLTSGRLEQLLGTLRGGALELGRVLSDIRAYGLAQNDSTKEDDSNNDTANPESC